MRKLSPLEAHQFALLTLAGVPPSSAIDCFLPPEGLDEDEIREAIEYWPQQQEVRENLTELSGGRPWQEMSKEERLHLALDKHYAEMAYFLWANNYSDLSGPDKQKADTCRAALEAKVAGTAGKGNALDRFYEDMVKLVKPNAGLSLPKLGLA